MATSVALPTVGSTMPDIGLIGTDGSARRLAGVTKDSRSVVFFMRSSSCAICLAHASALATMAENGELSGAKAVVITPGDAGDAEKVRARVPAKAVSVWASGQEHAAVGLGTFLTIQHSGTFVLAADGAVLSARAATIPTGSFSKDEVRAALA
ncbi:hypothetical protein BH09ACT5_BH09ACT5_03290 [soil metagenome]